MHNELTKAGRTILVLDPAECESALRVGAPFASVTAANAFLKNAARRAGAYAPYVGKAQLAAWGMISVDETGRSPAQVAAAKSWGAACAEGRRKKRQQP